MESLLQHLFVFLLRASGLCVNGVGKELRLETCAEKDSQYWVYSNT